MSDDSSASQDIDALSLDEALAAHSDDGRIVDVEEPTQQVVLFRLGTQRFALPGSAVHEILGRDQEVYYVPGLPASIEGVIHLRGAIESVIRLQPLLGLPAPSAAQGMILLVKGAGLRSGVRIDHLDDVCAMPQSAFKDAPDTLPEALHPFVAALLHENDARDATALLDADALMAAYRAGQG